MARLISNGKCVEVGAGDGTLTLGLERVGLRIPASDSKKWSHVVRYPDWVETLSAQDSLKKYQPEIVICSWPPPNNTFEHEILSFPSVKKYIVIGSQHDFAKGNRTAYKTKAFTCSRSVLLEQLIFPQETQPEVLIFDRHDAD